MGNLKIVSIIGNEVLLPKVKELWQNNSTTLGFFPDGAFEDYARRGQILVAVDKHGQCMGYILYRISGEKVIIVHLCIGHQFRKQGVAKQLFGHLKTITTQYKGIGLHCRRDYDANKIWSKLGLHPIKEKVGRSKTRELLTFWWYDHGLEDLFTAEYEQIIESKIVAVLDANIFFDIVNSGDGDGEAQALLTDWMIDDVEYCLTNEIFIEINRNPDPAQRDKYRRDVHKFTLLKSEEAGLRDIVAKLKGYFVSPKESTKSDLKQLANAIAGGAEFFITNDNGLLHLRERIHDEFNIYILRSCEMIGQLDEIIRNVEYQPARLAGSHATDRLVKSSDIKQLEKYFVGHKQGERINTFRREVRRLLSYTENHESRVILNNDKTPLALIVLKKAGEVLEIPLLRISNNALSKTISKHLIFQAILDSKQSNRLVTLVTDRFLSTDVVDALRDSFFEEGKGYWIKLNLYGFESIDGIKLKLQEINEKYPQFKSDFDKILALVTKAAENQETLSLLQAEKILWPVKIAELNIPTFVVPIKPTWAMHLFEKRIADQDLLGAKTELAVNKENAYYRAPRPKVLSTPGRVLWYVSKGQNILESMHVTACSYIDEVSIGKPKELFARYKRLGIYTWKDIYGIARENIDNDIMAFKFSRTELLSNPISWKELCQIYAKENGDKKIPIQSPSRISQGCFQQLYELGIGKNKAVKNAQ